MLINTGNVGLGRVHQIFIIFKALLRWWTHGDERKELAIYQKKKICGGQKIEHFISINPHKAKLQVEYNISLMVF
jgi:hypothetical protein